MIAVARRALEAAGFDAQWSTHPVGWRCWTEQGDPLPPATLDACRRADAILFGAITSKGDPEAQAELAPHLRDQGLRYRSPIVRLRRELDLWANVRPVHGNGVDLVLFRENTEDLYGGHEQQPVMDALARQFPGLEPGPDTAVTLRVITRRATERIIERAFAYAETQGRTRVTLLEKANVMRATGGLVRSIFHDVAARHPTLRAEEQHIDAACARIVTHPASFDVVVATNLFGDIFTDVAAAVAGGLPLAASANLGDTHALFEPVHGSAPDIAGKALANPCGAVRAAAMMARHLGQNDVASRLDAALDQATGHTTAEWERSILSGLRATALAT